MVVCYVNAYRGRGTFEQIELGALEGLEHIVEEGIEAIEGAGNNRYGDRYGDGYGDRYGHGGHRHDGYRHDGYRREYWLFSVKYW